MEIRRVQAVRMSKIGADCMKKSRRPIYSYAWCFCPHVGLGVGESPWSPQVVKKPKINSYKKKNSSGINYMYLHSLHMELNGERGLFIDNARNKHQSLKSQIQYLWDASTCRLTHYARSHIGLQKPPLLCASDSAMTPKTWVLSIFCQVVIWTIGPQIFRNA